ncbi:Na(+)/H(+) antiporter nhaA [Bartonella bacilliformis str. Heidi Mejia]|uniref:Na(+)/H(+) antiporter NhaA n=2 Tax=Bartonella bacilliformis TaxID=774 RepID=NHAA_BARBK|nr:Na+/H+ antiporter NhaA [Bartonella bacilliformis]A1URT7.1 RecName: Full=Na(+)/H(+) antiporter NhaA; AltName: Full=Sodium/proton antiporter NhaA [Bartonella bacilliformis KC583]ABM44900.1 Na+/H+ antiporter NhaA [Bartonella bacilliformis KC583]AMG85535.1 Na+/H+ antiporter NhaA [Bartonella bacilliformis]EKS44943.1 Na+/H+ antiporter NhaA [Bartonella bacilliformis INS]EYS90175.1 Na(+)/H(+) antiporter nhaA [Bartonella bacilliformis San Pedro600-02]EYS92339.1 Na(+)/H(+) antiporter nhaA [Bartonell
MLDLSSNRLPNRASLITNRAFSAIERFLHIEAMSGVVLLLAAATALILANSQYTSLYEAFWHTPLGFNFGHFNLSWDLHFWVNDVLMTIFFLVAGMEIRREIHEGALASVKQAILPIVAAIGGVCIPAIIYLSFNFNGGHIYGWAVPTATDIAFALGILALLGKAIPSNLHIILLSLAIIDDIMAVLIIAFFYSTNLDPSGLAIAAAGIALVFFFQWISFASAWLYVLPGAIIWWGLMVTGIHPSLAGVILGMMTPVFPTRNLVSPLTTLSNAIQTLQEKNTNTDLHHISTTLKKMRKGQRDIVAPVIRIQKELHPWVAYGVMPIFAFANAGVSFANFDLASQKSFLIVLGIIIGLCIGKPLGILAASYLAVKSGLCRLPPHVTWTGILLIGFLAGIGFTMSIFVSMLAFQDIAQLNSAKIGVLCGSGLSALAGLGYGLIYIKNNKKTHNKP